VERAALSLATPQSDWLTYPTGNVKARVPQSVWKMFRFYVIKRCEMRLR